MLNIDIPKNIFKEKFPNFYNKIKKFSLDASFIPITTEDASIIELFLSKNTNIGRTRFNKIINLISKVPISRWKEILYGHYKRPKLKINKSEYKLESEFSLTIIPDWNSTTKKYKLISDEDGQDYTEFVGQQTLNYAYKTGAKIFCKIYSSLDSGQKEIIFRTSKKKTKTVNN